MCDAYFSYIMLLLLLQDGAANDSYLIQLAEVYAEELELEDLNVFDALKDVWRYVNNEKSDYVLPKSVSLFSKL